MPNPTTHSVLVSDHSRARGARSYSAEYRGHTWIVSREDRRWICRPGCLRMSAHRISDGVMAAGNYRTRDELLAALAHATDKAIAAGTPEAVEDPRKAEQARKARPARPVEAPEVTDREAQVALATVPSSAKVGAVAFELVDGRTECPVCGASVSVTARGAIRQHGHTNAGGYRPGRACPATGATDRAEALGFAAAHQRTIAVIELAGAAEARSTREAEARTRDAKLAIWQAANLDAKREALLGGATGIRAVRAAARRVEALLDDASRAGRHNLDALREADLDAVIWAEADALAQWACRADVGRAREEARKLAAEQAEQALAARAARELDEVEGGARVCPVCSQALALTCRGELPEHDHGGAWPVADRRACPGSAAADKVGAWISAANRGKMAAARAEAEDADGEQVALDAAAAAAVEAERCRGLAPREALVEAIARADIGEAARSHNPNGCPYRERARRSFELLGGALRALLDDELAAELDHAAAVAEVEADEAFEAELGPAWESDAADGRRVVPSGA